MSKQPASLPPNQGAEDPPPFPFPIKPQPATDVRDPEEDGEAAEDD